MRFVAHVSTLGLLLLASVGCGGESESAQVLSGQAFSMEIDRICESHSTLLEADVFGPSRVDDLDVSLSDEEIEADIEATRRRLIDAKRLLLDQLGAIEPSGRVQAWKDALHDLEVAIERADEAESVDVTADGLGNAVNSLIDDFELERCF